MKTFKQFLIENKSLIVDIPISKILPHFHPLHAPPWLVDGDNMEPISPSEVKNSKKLLNRELGNPGHLSKSNEASRDEHIARIAYLLKNGWKDPIDIEINGPDWFDITDGNHRLAAAILKGNKTIKANVGGYIDYAEKLLGVKL